MPTPLSTKPKTISTGKAIVANTSAAVLVSGFVSFLLVHFRIDLGLSEAEVPLLEGLLTGTLVAIGHWVATRAFFQRIFAPAS